MCVPTLLYLKYSDPLPETQLFFLALDRMTTLTEIFHRWVVRSFFLGKLATDGYYWSMLECRCVLVIGKIVADSIFQRSF